jgi:hypothetical protein
MSLLDDVFEILETATRHEKSGNRIEAATKYFEATYLMRKVLAVTPQEAADTRRLLEQKIKDYSTAASRLYFDDSSTAPTAATRGMGAAAAAAASSSSLQSPVSQLTQQEFFREEVSHHPSQQQQQQPLGPTCESPRFTQSAELNKMAGQANSKLARAIDLDEAGKTKEALNTYMEAAELFLQTIRICDKSAKASSIAPVLKRRLEGALDRVEQLKLPKRNGVNRTKPPRTSQAQGKQVNDGRSTSTTASSSFTKDEIDVLKRSSLIASGVFLPWSDEEADALSRRVQELTQRRQQPSKLKLFVDKDGELPLADKQRNHFHRWARPSEIAQMRQSLGTNQHPPTMIRSVNPYSIRQKYVTDCSFIASLCICAAFEKRFRKRLITSIIYPQDSDGIPMHNPEGKYMVKLWLNGVARQVIVDDRLPIDRHSNLLCSHTTGNRNQMELWVSIIEKAYMKLCGGYDFPGSNRYEPAVMSSSSVVR